MSGHNYPERAGEILLPADARKLELFPELLAALKALTQAAAMGRQTAEQLAAARAAIAKAEGK